MKVNDKAPKNYEDWIDSGHVIIPCDKKRSILTKWSDLSFKLSKEEWKAEHLGRQMALRLDKYIDFDVDNHLIKRFTSDYLKGCSAIFGRKNSPTSHYLWTGSVEPIKFILPKELSNYTKDFTHGNTLCELRHDIKQYTLVPESEYHLNNEIIEWEHYEGIQEYSGSLKLDVGKIALSTALCILYPEKGDRDNYCTAIAGVLLSHTKWTLDEIDNFIYRISVEALDDRPQDRSRKGTTHSKSNRKLGMPTIASAVGGDCTVKTIQLLFSWIGITSEAVEGQEAIGDIIEYAPDRYEIEVNGTRDGVKTKVLIEVDGPTLMKQSFFYDEVMKQAQVWIPKMKPVDFEKIMKMKFETRRKSDNYIEEASEDLIFIKHFKHYIASKSAFTEKKNLLDFQLPFYDIKKEALEFNLDSFEDFLDSKRITIKRVDLVRKVKRILKANKNKGKVNGKSCVSWKIDKWDLPREQITIEGEYKEGGEVKEIDFEADAIED